MNHQRSTRLRLTGALALLVFVPPAMSAFAQSSGGAYTIRKSAVAGGGGASAGGTTQITGTAGQSATRTVSDGTNTVAAGFWTGAACTFAAGGGVIMPTTLPDGVVAQSYGQTLAGNGSVGPYTFVVTAGALPNGLSLSDAGVLSGTPTATGTSNFTVMVADGLGCTATQSFSLTVTCPAVTLSPVELASGQVGTNYAQSVAAQPAGGNYSYALTNGALPNGLTLNSANGAVSGAPSQAGTFNFRITTTGFGGCGGFRDYQIVIACAAVTVNPTTLPGGTAGTTYSQNISATPAATYAYRVTSGALPTGLTLNGASGAISGTPTIAGGFNFTVTATAGACAGSATYSLTIACAIAFTTTSPLPAAQAGVAYSQTLGVTPAGTYTFSLTSGSLPSGLTLNSSTGVLSGVPAVTGTYNFTVKAQTANGCSATQAYSLAVNCPTVAVTPASLPNGTTGAAYSQTLSATPAGGSYTFAVSSGALPGGLTLSPSSGLLSGTASASGTFNFTVRATGFGGCVGSQAFTVVISSGGCPTITLPATLSSGSVGQLYNDSVTASPAGSYSYTSGGGLPPDVTLFSAFGLLYGYPTQAGTYSFTITATDANQCSASRSYAVVISSGAVQAPAFNDFSGDRRSDFVLWRAAQAQWLIVDSATDQAQTAQWGQAGDTPVAGDFDGDGKADLAVFGKDGHWRIRLSGSRVTIDQVWGVGSDVPVPGDYDGDGKTDLAVWRGAEANWYILRSSDGQTQTAYWGFSTAPYFDVAVPGDYDGDGRTDVAVYRTSTGYWYIRRSSDGQSMVKMWGVSTDVPVPGDYDGDGKTDIAVWRGSTGLWYLARSSDGASEVKTWGSANPPYLDIPAAGDYDGDGKADAAVWRKSEGRWYVLQSSDGTTRVVTQGSAGDMVVMATPHN